MRKLFNWKMTVLLLVAGSLAGCGSSSSFFMVRNPFEDEANAIADFGTRSREKKASSSAGNEPLPHHPNPETPPPPDRPYFGRGKSWKVDPPTAGADRRAARENSGTPSQDPPVLEAPVPLSKKERVATPRPVSPGAICYRCNGKGHHLSSLSSDARMVECEDCTGTGRR